MKKITQEDVDNAWDDVLDRSWEAREKAWDNTREARDKDLNEAYDKAVELKMKFKEQESKK